MMDYAKNVYNLSVPVAQITLRLVLVIAVVLFLYNTPNAQGSFNSGSTGADGAFAPTQNQEIQTPPNGVFNYTTFNIPLGVVIKYLPNVNNTPVTILATGNVTILGHIIVDGSSRNANVGGKGGPGGFRGGDSGTLFDSPNGKPGDGPGGGEGGKGVADLSVLGQGGGGGYLRNGQTDGSANSGQGGPRYGTRTLIPLIGGSGGGGSSAFSGNSNSGWGGGGGGGAILIASSGSIILRSVAQGQDPECGFYARGGGANDNAGGGSGGAIRLVANSISGAARFDTRGGRHASSGYVRVEAFNLNDFVPHLDGSPLISYAQPNPVTIPNSPQIKIVSIGGISAPANPSGSFYLQPDVIVPISVSNPVTVALEANNLPTGTVISVVLTNEAGQRTTVNSTPLAGTQSSSTASAAITLPSTGNAVISASVTLNLLIAYDKPIYIDGERIDKIEITTEYGNDSQVTYISYSGKRLKMPK